ncbi:hypothetical protein Droror1_Dr00014241 [Drosera rotundifolia]
MARQPLPHPRLVGLVHALEFDAVFCDDVLGLEMTMIRRFCRWCSGLGLRRCVGFGNGDDCGSTELGFRWNSSELVGSIGGMGSMGLEEREAVAAVMDELDMGGTTRM